MNQAKNMTRPGTYEDELRYFGAILHQLCGRPENYDVRRARLRARRTTRTLTVPHASAPIVQPTVATKAKPSKPKPTGLASVFRFNRSSKMNIILQHLATDPRKRTQPAA